MSVNVSDGSLDFVSTLDNSDFTSKSLENIRLIKLQLELTGDTSGITKYDQAVKNALAVETKLRADLNKMLEEARIKTEQFAQEVQQATSAPTVFSKVKTELEELRVELSESMPNLDLIGGGGDFDLQDRLAQIQQAKAALNSGFEEGKLSAESFRESMTAISASEKEVLAAIEQTNAAQKESIIATKETSVAIEEELGLLEKLAITLKELKTESPKIIDPESLAANNALIEETENNIKKLNNAGRTGYDELGNAVEQNVEKQGKFGAALSRVTNLGNIGARVITQLSRQIIGLGVGFLSFAIGAKAIETVIEYISNLDIVTGRLNIAKQSLADYNDVLTNAGKGAAEGIANLKILYEAATDVNSAMKDRLAAAEELKKEFPNEFANTSALAIANGKLKDSYNDVTDAIKRQAIVEASLSKIKDLEGQKVDLELKQAEIQHKADIDKSQATGYAGGSSGSSATGGGGYQEAISKEQNQKGIQQMADYQKAKLQPEIDIIDQRVNLVEKIAGGAGALAKQLEGGNKLIQKPLEDFDSIIASAGSKADLDNIKAALQFKLNHLAPSDADFQEIRNKLQRVDDLEKAYQVKATKTTTSDPAISLLASQNSVLQQIDALRQKYASKETTRNEQQVNEVIAAYTKQYDSIIAQNVKYQNYLKTHSKAEAAAKGLQYIDPSSINNDEINAIQTLAGTQSVEDTKKQVEEQKAIFKQYEAFKLQEGSDTANQLYGNELKGYKTYLDYLKSLQPKDSELNSVDPYTKSRASAMKDFLDKEIPVAQKDELIQQQAHLEKLISQDQDYQDKRKTLIENAQKDIAMLLAGGYKDQADQAQRNLADQLTALDESNFKTLDSYKAVFDGIANLSRQQTQDNLNKLYGAAAASLANGTLSYEAYFSIIKQLDAASLALKNSGTPKTLQEIGQAFDTISQEVSKVNGTLGGLISTAGGALTALGKVTETFNKIDTSKGFFDPGNLTNEISLTTTALTSTLSIIDSITEASNQRKQAETEYYNSVLTFQEQYNIALDEQVRLQYQTASGSLFYTDTAKELSDAVQAYDAAYKQYKQSLTELQQGQAIVGTKGKVDGSAVVKDAAQGAVAGAVIGSAVPVIGTAVGAVGGAIIGALSGLFGGKKQINVLEPLLQAYPQLIDANGKFNESLAKTLIANNQVTDATKIALQTTISYYDEEQTALDQITTTLKSLVGDLGNSIQNALVTAFENGTDAAVAFQKAVSQILQNIIQQDLFVAIFGDQLSALQTNLQAAVLKNDGHTQEEIISYIEDFYKNAQALVPEYTAGLQAAQTAGASQGLTMFTGNTGSGGGISGGIQQSITEQTGTRIEGALNGIQLSTSRTNDILETQTLTLGQIANLANSQLAVMTQIAQNTKRGADNTDGISDTLNKIATNTSGSSISNELRAAGKMGY